MNQLKQANNFFTQGLLHDAYKLYLDIENKVTDIEILNIIKFNKKLIELKLGKNLDANELSSLSDANLYTNYCIQSYQSYLKSNKYNSSLIKSYPLVSVVMTSFNAEETIEESIESLINQDYPNLEIVICDDFSTDRTWQVLTSIANRCKAVHIYRLNSNFGTYIAKNVAIYHSKGEVIMFQDSDDISHPSRIKLSVEPLLLNNNLIASRSKYFRYLESSNKVVEIGGLISKFGLITLAVRRCVINEIGFFDTVRKAGDDEFFQRVVHLYGKQKIAELNFALYAAKLREGSLISDMLQIGNDKINQSSSDVRRAYVKVFQERFRVKPNEWFSTESFPSLPIRAQCRYPDTVISLTPHIHEKVYVSVCSIPKREKSLEQTLLSLYNQVDKIFVYLDKYIEVPQFLKSLKKVQILRSQDYPNTDFRDNAKFLMYDKLKSENQDFYYFTCDDDIVYPLDYVHTLIRTLEEFQKKAVVGLHGVILSSNYKNYFRSRIVYHFESHELLQSKIVSNLGTGTTAFHSSLFSRINILEWKHGGMVDIFFSLLCAKNNIPMVCIPRHKSWLYTSNNLDGGDSLCDEFRLDPEKEKLILSILQQNKWGYQHLTNCVNLFSGELRVSLLKSLPVFSNDVFVNRDRYYK